MCAIEYASVHDKQVLELCNAFRFGTKWGNLRNEMLVKLIWPICHECIERTLKRGDYFELNYIRNANIIF